MRNLELSVKLIWDGGSWTITIIEFLVWWCSDERKIILLVPKCNLVDREDEEIEK